MKKLIYLFAVVAVLGVVLLSGNDSEQVTQVVRYNHVQEQEVTENTEAPVIHDVLNQVAAEFEL